MPIKPLSRASRAMTCSRLVSTTRASATLSERADGLADHGKRVVARPFRSSTIYIRADQIKIIDLAPRDELVDLDCTGGFERDILEARPFVTSR